MMKLQTLNPNTPSYWMRNNARKMSISITFIYTGSKSTSTRRLSMISGQRLTTSRYRFTRSTSKLKIPSGKIQLSRGCVRTEKLKLQVSSTPIGSLRKIMSSSRKKTKILLSM
jgi:hypothetical protein